MKSLLIIVALTAGVWGYNLGSLAPVLQNDTTYKAQLEQAKAVCNQAHSEIDGASEDECGRLQDVTNTEYTCNQTGGYCWLEVR